MKSRGRVAVLVLILVAGVGVSAWVNLPPRLKRARADKHYQQGLELARQDKMDSALAEWRIATRLDPDYPAPYRKLGDYLLNKADRPDLAARIYAQLFAIDPDGPHICCNLAKALALTNELAEAREYARRAVEAEPKCALAHNISGIILVTDHQMKSGVGELERAVALEPANTIYATILAQAYLDTSDFAGAQRVLDTVLQREPNSSKAHFLLGWACARGGRDSASVEKALTHFRASARLEPDAVDTYSEWGKLLLETGHTAEACDTLKKAWKLNHHLPQIAHNLATAYRQLGNDKEAEQIEAQSQRLVERAARLRELEKRQQVDPGNTEVTYALAQAELDEGNLTDALRYVQRLLRRQPDDQRALEVLAQIYALGGKPSEAEAVRKRLAVLSGKPMK